MSGGAAHTPSPILPQGLFAFFLGGEGRSCTFALTAASVPTLLFMLVVVVLQHYEVQQRSSKGQAGRNLSLSCAGRMLSIHGDWKRQSRLVFQAPAGLPNYPHTRTRTTNSKEQQVPSKPDVASAVTRGAARSH